jgi:hypothetical protein
MENLLRPVSKENYFPSCRVKIKELPCVNSALGAYIIPKAVNEIFKNSRGSA